MTDNRSERFYSKGFKGVTVTKGRGNGNPLLSNRQRGDRKSQIVKGQKGFGKSSLVIKVADSAGLSLVQASKAVDGVMEAISAALAEGETVRLVGFGTFSVAKRQALTGRNPRTGEPMAIDEVATPRFKAGKHLKDAVN